MTEQLIRRELREAVAQEPPLRLDVDGLTTRARRGARRRTLLTTTATTALIILATLIPTLNQHHHDGGKPSADAAIDPATLWPSPPADGTGYSAEEYGVVAEYLPEVIDGAFGIVAADTWWEGLEVGDNHGRHHRYGELQQWNVDFTLADVTGEYRGEVGAISLNDSLSGNPQCDENWECEAISVPQDQGKGLYMTSSHGGSHVSEVEIRTQPGELCALRVEGTSSNPAPLGKDLMTSLAIDVCLHGEYSL